MKRMGGGEELTLVTQINLATPSRRTRLFADRRDDQRALTASPITSDVHSEIIRKRELEFSSKT